MRGHINYDWDSGSPGSGVSGDYFTARRVGTFDFESSDYEFTARLLDGISGTVYTTGDNAYGRHKARTRPTPGNQDYNTPEASGYGIVSVQPNSQVLN